MKALSFVDKENIMEKVYTKNAPPPVGPYSQGIKTDGFIFFSGQIAINPDTGEFESGLESETIRVCENIKALLQSENLSFENVVKTTCFLINPEHFLSFNEIYAKYFTSEPARSCVFVKALPKNALVEIEVIAKI